MYRTQIMSLPLCNNSDNDDNNDDENDNCNSNNDDISDNNDTKRHCCTFCVSCHFHFISAFSCLLTAPQAISSMQA